MMFREGGNRKGYKGIAASHRFPKKKC